MALLFANNANGTLAAPITSAATSLTLNVGQAALFPSPTSPDGFYVTLTDAATQTNIEIVLVTAVAGNIFAITRAQDGSFAQSWLAGDIVSLRAIALEMRLWNAVVPSGGIIMWSGSTASIPNGWVLCDGTNGTPNLKDSFVIGAGNLYAVGATGGATSVTLTQAQLPSHTHAATAIVNDPGHAHNGAFNVWQQGGGNNGAVGPGQVSAGTATFTTAYAFTGISVSVTNAATGSGSSFSILPPYYALAYIMKT